MNYWWLNCLNCDHWNEFFINKLDCSLCKNCKRCPYAMCGANDLYNGMRKFYDVESDRILTEQQLRSEYEKFKYDIELSSGATTFEEALSNYLSKNGSLQEIKSNVTIQSDWGN